MPNALPANMSPTMVPSTRRSVPSAFPAVDFVSMKPGTDAATLVANRLGSRSARQIRQKKAPGTETAEAAVDSAEETRRVNLFVAPFDLPKAGRWLRNGGKTGRRVAGMRTTSAWADIFARLPPRTSRTRETAMRMLTRVLAATILFLAVWTAIGLAGPGARAEPPDPCFAFAACRQ